MQGISVKGLKNVRNRRTDALAQVGWERLESMLAEHYRGQGYAVDHCGTGASRSRFDGGIDLKLRKDDAYVLVQCKHWNAKQVPHNAVHELMGLTVNEGATGAILVTSGEFTRAAIEAATRQGHVQLVDGDDLRAMLGPLPEPSPPTTAGAWTHSGSLAQRAASTVGERLLTAVEDRIRHGGDGHRSRGHGVIGTTAKSALTFLLIKIVFALVLFLILALTLQSVVGSIMRTSRPVSAGQPVREQDALPAPDVQASTGVLREVGRRQVRQPELIDHYTGTTIEDRPGGGRVYRAPTAAEIRESQRQADEAVRIIEASTPEM